MATNIRTYLIMSLANLLIVLRKDKGLTQQQMDDTLGIHVNSLKKYEAGQAQPSLDALKKIALALHVSTDFLLFEEHERGPDDSLALQFEALQQFSPEDKEVAKSVLEGLILKHDSNRFNQAS